MVPLEFSRRSLVGVSSMQWHDVEARSIISVPEGEILSAVALIRSASLRELRDEKFLREEFLLLLGLNDEVSREFPQALYPWCGKGIRSWQYPIQFARYLTFLADRDIRSYVEIGCRFGGTFIIVVEYLRRFSDLYRASALDINPTQIMMEYAAMSPGVDYRLGDSASPELRSYLGALAWDLAFIDGDHSYNGCRCDYESVRQRSKLIVFHDIVSDVCPGVIRVWDEICKVMPSTRLFEAVDQYKEVRTLTNSNFLGIGVVDFS